MASENKIKVFHKGCGGQIGWATAVTIEFMESNQFFFMDGSQPSPQDTFRIHCDKCNSVLGNKNDMTLHEPELRLELTDCCDQCRFAYKPPLVNEDNPDIVCRRYPPVLLKVNEAEQFPLSAKSSWCGEFKK